MVRHPQSFLGQGTPPATDPRTVRRFGWMFAGMALLIFALSLGSLLQG
jgi:hypothetical protein